MDEAVLIGVDPHKGSNTAAVIDPATRVTIEVGRFANTADGYQQLQRFVRRWSQRRWRSKAVTALAVTLRSV